MAEIIDYGGTIVITVGPPSKRAMYAYRTPIGCTATGSGNLYVVSGWEIRIINIASGINNNLCYLPAVKSSEVIKVVAAHGIFILLITATGWYRYDMLNASWLVGSVKICEECGGQISNINYTVSPAGVVDSHYTCISTDSAIIKALIVIKGIPYMFDHTETTGVVFNNRFIETVSRIAEPSRRIQFIDIRTGYNYSFPEGTKVFNIERHQKNTVITATQEPSNAKCSYNGTYTVIRGQKAQMNLGPIYE